MNGWIKSVRFQKSVHFTDCFQFYILFEFCDFQICMQISSSFFCWNKHIWKLSRSLECYLVWWNLHVVRRVYFRGCFFLDFGSLHHWRSSIRNCGLQIRGWKFLHFIRSDDLHDSEKNLRTQFCFESFFGHVHTIDNRLFFLLVVWNPICGPCGLLLDKPFQNGAV